MTTGSVRATPPRRDSALVGALVVTMALTALDATIVATAVPSIVGSLGGFALFPWIFSIYLLAQAVAVPIGGRLSDQLGRKPVMLVGVAVFLVGSLLCGLAWSMVALVVFRAVQGVGAGLVYSLTYTIIGDLYAVERRGRVQAYVSSVFGLSSAVGPVVGGALSEYLSWRWTFFINLPVGLCALALLVRHLPETVTTRRRSEIDYPGAVVLGLALSTGMFVLLQGGVKWPWSSPQIVVLGAAALVLFAIFILVERRRVEPIIPLWAFRRRTLLVANLGALGLGALIIGVSAYIPSFAQGVLGAGPITAGLAMATVSVGWPVAASQASRLYVRLGFRSTAIIGSAVLAAGAAGLAFGLGRTTPLVWVAGASFVVGLGLGLVATASIVAVQSDVALTDRGAVTGANLFCRSMGSAVGAAIFGAVANAVLQSRLERVPAGLTDNLPSSVDGASEIFKPGTDPRVVTFVSDALGHASHAVFLTMLVAAIFTLALQFALPRVRDISPSVRDSLKT